MEKRAPLFIVVILCIIFLSINVSALTASIDKPKMVLYKNITQGQTIEFEQSVIVNNDNQYEVDIELTISSDWKDKVKITEPQFKMQAGETKEVFYTITLDEKGFHQGEILVTFRYEPDKSQLSLAQEIGVVVTEVDSSTSKITGATIGTTTKAMLGGGALLIVLLVILIILVNIKKSSKPIKKTEEK